MYTLYLFKTGQYPTYLSMFVTTAHLQYKHNFQRVWGCTGCKGASKVVFENFYKLSSFLLQKVVLCFFLYFARRSTNNGQIPARKWVLPMVLRSTLDDQLDMSAVLSLSFYCFWSLSWFNFLVTVVFLLSNHFCVFSFLLFPRFRF